MRFLDTDVMVDLLRGYAPAVSWLNSLGEKEIGIPGLVLMELYQGCASKAELQELQGDLSVFPTVWPTNEDCERALSEFIRHHLSHHLGIMDALIGACAVGHHAVLCTFNTKHFKMIPGLKTERPYIKTVVEEMDLE